MNDLFPSPHAIDVIILRVLTVRDEISDLLVAVVEVALRLHLVLRVRRLQRVPEVRRLGERAGGQSQGLDLLLEDRDAPLEVDLGGPPRRRQAPRGGLALQLTPPPPDVRIEGLEVVKPGTQEYEDKYGEQDRRELVRTTQRFLKMEIEACGGDYDEVVARVQESSPGASSLSGDDLVWRVAEVWKRAMESR